MPKPNNAPQGRKSLMDNRVVSILMALACGLATWLVVTIYIDPQGSTTIRDVPINYANSAPLEMSKVFVSLQKIVSYACYGIVLVLALPGRLFEAFAPCAGKKKGER